MGFALWRETAADMATQQALLMGAAYRFIQQKLSQGWNNWRAEAEEMRRQKRTTSGAIRRMLNRKLSMAFETWQYHAALIREALEERRRRQMAMRKAILKFQN